MATSLFPTVPCGTERTKSPALGIGLETTYRITETHKLHSDLDHFSSLFRHAPGLKAFSSGPEHRIQMANEAYVKYVGHRPLIGLPARKALPEFEGHGYFELMDQVYATGEPINVQEAPVRILGARDGEPEEAFISFTYMAVRDNDAQVTGLFFEGFDVTEAVRAREQVLRLQSDLLHVSRVSAMGTMASALRMN